MKERRNARLETGRWVFGWARKPRMFWFHFWRRDLRYFFVSGSWYCQIQTTWLIMFFLGIMYDKKCSVCKNNFVSFFYKSELQAVLPERWNTRLKPLVLHFAGTGDHFFWRRRVLMAKPMVKERNIGSLILGRNNLVDPILFFYLLIVNLNYVFFFK